MEEVRQMQEKHYYTKWDNERGHVIYDLENNEVCATPDIYMLTIVIKALELEWLERAKKIMGY